MFVKHPFRTHLEVNGQTNQGKVCIRGITLRGLANVSNKPVLFGWFIKNLSIKLAGISRSSSYEIV